MTDISAETVKEKIYALTRYGLIDIQEAAFESFRYRENLPTLAFKINNHFLEKLLSHEDEKTLLDALIGERAEGELVLDDFGYMHERARHLIEVIEGAANDSERKNKNYGVYGVPGVGKTQFMAVIQRETGIPVYFVGAAAKKSGSDPLLTTFKEPKRSESLGDLLRASFIAKRLKLKVILVKDEAEGVLTISTKDANKEDSSNKGFINYFLDNNTTPTIFITNDLDLLQPAIKRRLVSWTAFRQPPTTARAAILAGQFTKHKLKGTQDFALHLAEEFPELSPGVTAKTLQDIASRPGSAGIPQDKLQALILDQFQEQQLALNNGTHYAVLPPKPKTLPNSALWAANMDLDRLAAQLDAARRGFILAMIGPFGSGKKTFAHAIAARQNKRIIERSFSDIPFGNPLFFDTFSDCIETAKLDNGIVLLSGQGHLTQPGAFILDHYLRLIEATKIPVILTIDAPPDKRPPAKLADAAFETVHFHHLDPVQSMLAFHHFFGRPAPAVLQTFKTLTPSIFANLADAIDQTGIVLSDEEIVEKLHRRVNEYKMAGLVPLNSVIGFSDTPEKEIESSTMSAYRRNEQLLVPRGVPLTLSERYDLLKKLPKAIQWKDVAHFAVGPDKAGSPANAKPNGTPPTVH